MGLHMKNVTSERGLANDISGHKTSMGNWCVKIISYHKINEYHKLPELVQAGIKNGCGDGWTNHGPVENSFDEELISSLAYIKNIVVDRLWVSAEFYLTLNDSSCVRTAHLHIMKLLQTCFTSPPVLSSHVHFCSYFPSDSNSPSFCHFPHYFAFHYDQKWRESVLFITAT